jgi:hypothetical protein
VPQRTGQPLDVVLVSVEGVEVWLLPRWIDVVTAYNLDGIADRVTVVVPEREVGTVLESVPATLGVSSIGSVAGTPALLQIRESTPLPTWNVSAIGELLTRDQLALMLTDLGRAVSPFSVRSELLAELLDLLPPAAARQCVLAAMVIT